MAANNSSGMPRHVGRYVIYDAIAMGGMATVHLGRLVGPVGFARTIAIKRLHPQFAHDPDFVSMFLDEARLAARIQHPNVVPTIDVISTDGELLLVMEFVRGESLSKLIRQASKLSEAVPPRYVVSIMVNALNGLHAAHEAQDEAGRSLSIVHRDVSPQNILVGIDGVARVLDFGVAKAEDRVQSTQGSQLKGKLLYMSPEQLEAGDLDRRTDLYAMGVVLFEALTGVRMFAGDRQAAQIQQIREGRVRLPSELKPELERFDAIVRKATARDPAARYATAREMARALEGVEPMASSADLGDWVERVAGEVLSERIKRIAEIEGGTRVETGEVRAGLAETLARAQSLPPLTDAHSGVTSTPKPKAGADTKRFSKVWMAAPLLLVAVAATLFFVFGRRPDAAPPPPPRTADTASEPPVVIAKPPVTTTLPTASAIPGEVEDLAPKAVPSASVAKPAAPHASASASAKKPDCEQPYVLDSTGHMHFRKECL